MSESVLNKDFKESDVQRIRNIVKKKYNDKTKIQTGYEHKLSEYKEGDQWEENGKTWTIINGLKQTVTKYDSFKKLFQFPLACPGCMKAMDKNNLNIKAYFLYKTCFNCMIEYETNLKIKGSYKNHEDNIINKNKNEMIDDLGKAITEWSNTPDETYMTEVGDIDRWEGGENKQKIAQELKEQLQQAKIKNI